MIGHSGSNLSLSLLRGSSVGVPCGMLDLFGVLLNVGSVGEFLNVV